ncbi:MAG: DUF7507 domain-containing protein, partial [Candidatus Promineifilaceae bacterium]
MIKRILALLVVFACALAMILALGATAASVANAQEGQEGGDAESAREADRARAAEAAPAAAAPHFALLPTGLVTAPLFVGVDEPALPSYRIDPDTNMAFPAFSGGDIWAAAYLPAGDQVYFTSGSTMHVWVVGSGTFTTLGPILSSNDGASLVIEGMGYADGTLYGSRTGNTVANPEGLYAIDPATLSATLVTTYSVPTLETTLSGLDADPATGLVYATNDASALRGLVQIDLDGTVTLLAPYPANETDIDGLAVGDGKAFLITDESGAFYIFDLGVMTYTGVLSSPWPTSEIFAAGAWLEVEPQPRSEEIEPNDVFTDANPLFVPGPVEVSANITPAGDIDWFSLEATAGNLLFSAVRTGESPIGQQDSQLRAYDSDGATELEFDDDDGDDGGLGATLASVIAGLSLSETETIYLRVNEFQDDDPITPYKLYAQLHDPAGMLFETEPNDTSTTANALPNSALVSGTIDIAENDDWYSVPLIEGETLFAALDGDPGRPPNSGTDFNLSLYAPDGTTLIWLANDFGGDSLTNPPAEAGTYEAPADGVYYLLVEGAGTAVGDYLLSVGALPSVIPPTNPEIELAKTVGEDPSACATTDLISVGAGTEVTYCFEVFNTGNVTFTEHDLVDSELGAILTDFPFILAPAASTFVTQSAVITETTVNTATWTATDGVETAEDSDTATVLIAVDDPLVCNGDPVGFDVGIPLDWASINNAPGNPVFWANLLTCEEGGNYTGGAGDVACASSDLQGGGSGLYDTELRSNPFDLTGGVNTISLDYLANYANFGGVDFLDLDISADGGVSWTNLLSWNEDHGS